MNPNIGLTTDADPSDRMHWWHERQMYNLTIDACPKLNVMKEMNGYETIFHLYAQLLKVSPTEVDAIVMI